MFFERAYLQGSVTLIIATSRSDIQIYDVQIENSCKNLEVYKLFNGQVLTVLRQCIGNCIELRN